MDPAMVKKQVHRDRTTVCGFFLNIARKIMFGYCGYGTTISLKIHELVTRLSALGDRLLELSVWKAKESQQAKGDDDYWGQTLVG